MLNKNRNSTHNGQPFCGTRCCGVPPKNSTTRAREARAWKRDQAVT